MEVYLYASLLCEGLGRNTSLISLTLTLNFYSRVPIESNIYVEETFNVDDIPDDGVLSNISLDSFTLTINDFSGTRYHWDSVHMINADWGYKLPDLWHHYKSLNTFNLTLNNWRESSVYRLRRFLDEVMNVNLSRTLRLKINDSRIRNKGYPKYDFSELVVKSPSLELIELTICYYEFFDWFGCPVSWLETLKWEKQ